MALLRLGRGTSEESGVKKLVKKHQRESFSKAADGERRCEDHSAPFCQIASLTPLLKLLLKLRWLR